MEASHLMSCRAILSCAAAAAALATCFSGCASAGGPVISGITGVPKRVARYSKVEITFKLSRTYDNPFDPGQISVAARVRAAAGKEVEIPAFPYQEYRGEFVSDREKLQPIGGLVWKVRYAPIEVGRHTVTITARDSMGASESKGVAFEAVASKGDSYIRRSEAAPRLFQFDSGEPFFATGENVCWPSQATPLRDYETWFGHLSEAGCNCARLWLAGPFIATAPIHSTDDPNEVGPGRYSQRSSWRLDQVVAMAETRGIYLMLCLDSFNSLRTSQPYPAFDQYPLNARFGGPLKTPDEFFTNPEARKLFRQRLRYYVARWGYSTHVFAWEFWNEVDIIERYRSAEVAAWHRDMARYLRSIDPWSHLITTSFARSEGDPAVDSLPEMDFVQTHCYGPRDTAGALLGYSRDKAKRYNKPHFVGEFGADASGKNDLEDKQAIHLHNGIWATALSGDAGAAMTWWWDQYVEPGNLYHHFAALSRFLRDVSWAKEKYHPATVESITFPPGTPLQPTDLTVDPKIASWDKHPANQPREYRVSRDGTIDNFDRLSRLLHGVVNHPAEHNPPTFIVDYPTDGAFDVIVDGVSGWGGANLRVRLDGETKLSADFPDTKPDDHETMRQYDKAYRIEVPAGPHRITVENEGNDWAFVSYRFVGYVTAPDVRVVGLTNATSALLWIQNRANTWWNAAQGIAVKPVPPVAVALSGFSDGDYSVEWWDAYAGVRIETDHAKSSNGRLTIQTPGITRDIACKVLKRPRRGK